MQRSRIRKIDRLTHRGSAPPAGDAFAKLVRHASIAAAVMAAIASARAQQVDTGVVGSATSGAQAQQSSAAAAAPSATPSATGTAALAETSAAQGGLQEVIVTATKRAESIQSLPLTISAISQTSLENQNIQDFQDYALALPQVSFTNENPGHEQIYMRGIATGAAYAQSSSNQTVGIYLDEQPITTPNGPLDLHMYDIARVEVLPGPQGTLYGAESEAGTIRIITNQPDPTGFHAGYTGQLNTVYNGTVGGIAEGFINLPITSNIAVRIVGWYERDSGFVNNVSQAVTFNTGFTLGNAPFVQNHYNPVTTDGARAEFKFNINDNWSINPTLITQKLRYDGNSAVETWKDLAAGPAIPSTYSVAEYEAEPGRDSFVDGVLTVLGKIGNFDLTYSGAYLTRDTYLPQDYVDYTLAYQQYEYLWPKDPLMYKSEADGYQVYSNELRITSPTDYPVRLVAGIFQERQEALTNFQEPIAGLNPFLWVGYGTPYLWPNMDYLALEQLVQRDWAAFAEANWDITANLTATVGFRRFRYDNTLQGFSGFGLNAYDVPPPPPLYPGGPPGPGGIIGQQTCITTTPFHGAPCQDQDENAEGWGSTPKFNLSYKFDPNRLIYATFSKGFRPGGVQRLPGIAPFGPDYLTNYEVGWKTAWLDQHLIFNGALYYERWKNFQFSFTGQFGLGVTANAGNAEVKGAEGELQWRVTRGLSLTASVAYNDAYLTQNYCGLLAPNGQPITSNNCVGPGNPTAFTPKAFEGGKLPYSSLWKTSLTARYTMPFASGTAFVEGDQTYQSFMWTNLETVFQRDYGPVPAYGLTNFSLGFDKNNWDLQLLVKNAFNRYAVDDITSEDQKAVSIALFRNIVTPRLIGLQFSQQF
jgi:iron complex outermembrane recepter protein